MIFLSASYPIQNELKNVYKDTYDKYIKSHSESPKREIEMNFEKELLKEFDEKKMIFLKYMISIIILYFNYLNQ